jgi:ribosomal protein S18 acetylase RimI-like enzyme
MRLVPIPHWLRIYAQLAEMPDTASELHASLIRSIRPDCAFALLELDDEPVACALGVLEHDLLGVFDVITAREQRGNGYADQLLRHLLLWGKAKGAQHAYLQVIADNAAALKLYDRLGFRRLYNYWYRLTS